jgi:hypothetical protein
MLSESEIKSDMSVLKQGFNTIIRKIDCFSILDKELVPEGLKPHTRSISWLVEQIVVQQTRKHLRLTEFEKVVASKSDVEQYDCKVNIKGNETLVNLKVTDVTKHNGRNDINKAYKLYQIFKTNPKTRLYYVILKISFENVIVHFANEPPIVFYVPWVKEVYVNPSNHHLQASYYGQTIRTTKEFVDLIDKELETKRLPRK